MAHCHRHSPRRVTGHDHHPHLGALIIPFASSAYRPIWVGLGQIAFYLLLLVTFTFYIRRQIGNRLWHGIHYLSYLVFAMILLHGLLSGTDSANPWVFWMYIAG